MAERTTRPEAPPQINCAFEALNGAKRALWPGDPTRPIAPVSGDTLVQLAQAEANLAVAEELRALREAVNGSAVVRR